METSWTPLANQGKSSSSTARQVPESQRLHANYSKHYQCHSGTFRLTTSAIPRLYRWHVFAAVKLIGQL